MTSKILIADDDYFDLETIKRHLKNEYYQLITAGSGEEAISLLKSHGTVDLVILDGIMPGMSGFDTCRKIKKINSEIPIILVTGLKDEDSLKLAFDSGAIDFISKPVKKLEVISRIKNALCIKKAEKEIKSLYNDLIKDIELARCVQSYLVADWINVTNKYTLSASYSPASGVSGDLYDIVKLSQDKYLLYVGDISGHGIQASLIMAAIQMAIKFEVMEYKENLNVVNVVNKLNKIFSEKFSATNYMTFVIGILDFSKDTFQYFSAGHPPLITYDKTTNKAELKKEKGSIPIGMISGIQYLDEDLNELTIDNNTGLMLYTDGLFECSSPDDEKFELNSLVSAMCNTDYTSFVSLPEELLTSLKNKEYTFDDDITILFIAPYNQNNAAVTLAITPELEKVIELRTKLTDMLKDFKISADIILKLELLIAEHINNLIIHGVANFAINRLEKILLSIKLIDNKVIIETSDKYRSWDFYNKLENIRQKKDLDEEIKYNISGRGLSIIDSIADSIEYKRFNKLNYYKFTLNLNEDV